MVNKLTMFTASLFNLQELLNCGAYCHIPWWLELLLPSENFIKRRIVKMMQENITCHFLIGHQIIDLNSNLHKDSRVGSFTRISAH